MKALEYAAAMVLAAGLAMVLFSSSGAQTANLLNGLTHTLQSLN